MQQFLNVLLYIVLAITSVFLICLVLIQRGKGGGLAGAFGGAGSSSAFGTKAGDVFTRVTMITAGVWIALNMLLVVVSNRRTSAWGSSPAATSTSKSDRSDLTPPLPVDPKADPVGQTIELPPGSPFLKDDKAKTSAPATPPSTPVTAPVVPPALPETPKAATPK